MEMDGDSSVPLVPLRYRVVKSDGDSDESDTVYGRGFSKHISSEMIEDFLSIIEHPIEIDFSRRHVGGVIWAKYSTIDIAGATIRSLHQSHCQGYSISLRFELGVDIDGKPIVPRANHNTVIRQIKTKNKEKKLIKQACYSHRSITVDETEYPFPSGLYLSRIIQLTRTISSLDNPLMNLITDVSISPKYTKEISEAMAMVDAVQRSIKLVFNCEPTSLSMPVNVYVLGDGKQPLCAACLS
jgi:hypothetical protein